MSSTASKGEVPVISARKCLLKPQIRTFLCFRCEIPGSQAAPGRFILVADFRKNVEYLGTNVRLILANLLVSDLISLFQFTPGVPIEVVPFAYAKVLQNLHHILGSPNASLRMAVKKGIHIPPVARFVIY